MTGEGRLSNRENEGFWLNVCFGANSQGNAKKCTNYLQKKLHHLFYYVYTSCKLTTDSRLTSLSVSAPLPDTRRLVAGFEAAAVVIVRRPPT